MQGNNEKLRNLHQGILDILQKAANKLNREGQSVTVNSIYDADLAEHCGDNEIARQYREAMGAYKTELYKTEPEKILAGTDGDTSKSDLYGSSYCDDFNIDDFNYYISIFKQIQASGGVCRPISDYKGNAANDSEWLQAMIQCGELSIDIVDKDKKTGLITLDATSPSSDISLSYTPTTEIDKIENSVKKCLEDIEYDEKASKFIRYTSEKAHIGVQFFNKGMVILSTFAPSGSDDIEFGVGLTMMAQSRSKCNVENSIIVDCHNSFTAESGEVLPGNSEVFQLINVIDTINPDQN